MQEFIALIIVMVLIVSPFLAYHYYREVKDLNDTVSWLTVRIDDANSEIVDAQGEAWTNYDNMGFTLENLTVK